MSETAGIVLLDKPEGVSSFAALGPLKRALGTRKIGHTGTLDPFASGLLVVVVGPLTRLAPLLTGSDKTYEATFTFGQETNTLDPEGTVVTEGPIPDFDTISAAVSSVTGTISQEPPVFSAIHVQGRRAYELARAGNAVALAPRTVTVYSFEVLDWTAPHLRVRISCSSGTYVRSLARDLARDAGSVATVTALRRTRVGVFSVDDAHADASGGHTFSLMGARAAVDRLSSVSDYRISAIDIDDRIATRVATGKTLSRDDFGDGLEEGREYALFADKDALCAVVEVKNGRVAYHFVVPRST